MTVSTELSHEEYVGNGVTTDFDFRFRIFEGKHLIVVVADIEGNETTLKNGTDYTIVGAGSYHGGKVVLNKPLAQDWKILLERDLPVVQETDLRNQGKFFAEVHEDAFDYLTMLIQKALGTFSLSLRKPTYLSNYYDAKGNRIANLALPKLGTDSANKDYVDNSIKDIDSKTLRVKDKPINALPNTEQRANKILAFDDNGQPITVLPESGSASDVLIELGKPRGSKLIGHNNSTVRDELDRLDSKIICLSGNTGFDKIGRFLNIDSLRECAPTNTGMIVYVVSAYSEAEDEHHYGGGHFQSFDNSASHVEDDGGIVIVPASGDIAWRRINFTAYDMCFWGVKPDGKTDNAEAITRATGYAKNNRVILEAPRGDIHTSEAVPIYDNMGIKGQGKAESTVFYKTTNNKFKLKKDGNVALEVDALCVFVPEKWDLLDSSMGSFCQRGIIERCMFRRLGLTTSNVTEKRPYYGIFLGKSASPYIREVGIEGVLIGIKAVCAFSGIIESVGISQWNGYGYTGIDFSQDNDGIHYMSGTSMDMRLVQVRGFQFGFHISKLQYSTMLDCTAEEISPMHGESKSYAFYFKDPYCITMNGCATEYVTGGQVMVIALPNASFRPALKITGYLPIDQKNPKTPTPMFSVDGGGEVSMNVVIDASDLTRQPGLNNLLPPRVSGSGAKVIVIGCAGEDWNSHSGGAFNRLA